LSSWRQRRAGNEITDAATKLARGEALRASADPGLRQWPSFGPERHLGQLHPEYQQMLADERATVTREECDFYHTVELSDGTVISGPWDLRGREREYLGHVELSGKTVLELGPATGHLTYIMERAGADVVSFDVGYDVSMDLMPAPIRDTRQLRFDHARNVTRAQNSWWLLHRDFASSARMVYGDIYALPGDIGEFDVSVFCAILLHLKSPIAALEQAARRTRSTIVITEPWPYGSEMLHENVMRPFPLGDGGHWVIWWSISAGAVVRMLETLGFKRSQVIEHKQSHQFGHVTSAPFEDIDMYTVVAERG
jgi:hypothetical protein